MTEQFRHYDRPRAPRVVSIQWERQECRDDCQDAPDENDDGFWPSLDPKAAGYIGENPERDFETQQEAAEARMKAWREGDWYYIGVRARAHISIPCGGNGDSFVMYTIDSPGLWGIESDAGKYLDEVFEEQKAELLAHLRTLGEWIIEQDKVTA